MLTLYVETGCPYCARAISALNELKLDFVEKNIEDQAVADELVARGGKLQMPYLVDDEHGVEMYESDDIVDYLHATFGKEPVS